ncbi:Uncharacterized protein Veg [Ligilactobacillus sp. WC1T17]|uniref:Uncharacterized protein Veg n=1 Tax=Ligilactobacillus ruminis TaxID=1623 RepID=A0ABY1ACT0_9LACO|nr:Uncharacterized protein Veg [Ligilactobacillus ruminis]
MPNNLADIKNKLDRCVGDSLTVTSHIGRKKVNKCHGVLKETFPAIFIIELDDENNAVKRVSYSYTDVLTKNIKIDFASSSAAQA